MSLSIYTSAYNLTRIGIDWRDALSNWLHFLHGHGQIVVAVNRSEDNSLQQVTEWAAKWTQDNPHSNTRIDVVATDIPYTDPTFDGQIKAAALARCTQPFATLLDLDERLIPSQWPMWRRLANELGALPNVDAFLIPVVDLMGDEHHYRAIGSKFYLHKNRPDITRGVVREARLPDGSIDTSRSDSTEPIIRETGELVRAAAIVMSGLPDFLMIGQLENGNVPFVVHLGWMDLEQRVKQSEFWAPVWTARRGGREPEKQLTLADLQAMPRMRHRLPTWKERR